MLKPRIYTINTHEEGNNFKPILEITDQAYIPDCTWCGEIQRPGEPYEGDEHKAIVFWPLN